MWSQTRAVEAQELFDPRETLKQEAPLPAVRHPPQQLRLAGQLGLMSLTWNPYHIVLFDSTPHPRKH